MKLDVLKESGNLLEKLLSKTNKEDETHSTREARLMSNQEKQLSILDEIESFI